MIKLSIGLGILRGLSGPGLALVCVLTSPCAGDKLDLCGRDDRMLVYSTLSDKVWAENGRRGMANRYNSILEYMQCRR